MNRDGRSSSNDPTGERTAAQPPASPGGPSAERPDRDPDRPATMNDDVVDRTVTDSTPRRYDQPLEADPDPVMPSDDATMNTKI